MRDPRFAGLTLRPADETDDVALRRMNELAFPDNPKARADLTRWQYWTNPFGETVAFVVEDGADVVGQYAAYCMPARFGDRSGRVAIGVDIGVLPSHRGRGIGPVLTDAVFAACVGRGMPVYSFPNDLSVRAAARSGWVDVCRVEVHVLPIGTGAVADRVPGPQAIGGLLGRAAVAVAGRRGRPSSPDVVEVAVATPDAVPEDLDALWAQESDHHRWGVVRDATWWRWRFGGHPDHPYEVVTARRRGRLVGAGVIGTRDDIGGTFRCLYELLAVDDDAAKSLVSAVRDGARAPGLTPVEADGVAVAGNPGTRITSLARAAGLVRVPDRLLPTPLRFGVVPDAANAPRPADHVWATAWGDNDHI